MSIFGWLTLKEAERYTRAAERKRLAKSGKHLLARGEEKTKGRHQIGGIGARFAKAMILNENKMGW